MSARFHIVAIDDGGGMFAAFPPPLPPLFAFLPPPPSFFSVGAEPRFANQGGFSIVGALDAAKAVVHGARRGNPRALAFVSKTVAGACRGDRNCQATGAILSHAARLADRQGHFDRYLAIARVRGAHAHAAGAFGGFSAFSAFGRN